MAITVYGVEANLDVTQWSGEAYAAQRVSPAPHGVLSGFVVSVSTGTRLLSVSTGGHAYVPGARVVSDAAVAVTLDANTSGNPRIDTIVLQVNWAGTASTAGSVVVLKGTPGVAPERRALTQTWGVLWQIPLAHVTVANGAGQLVAGNVENAYPQADTGRVTLTLPASFEHGSPPLAAHRRGGVTEFSGTLYRTSNIGGSASVSLGVIIPEAFRPLRDLEIESTADRNGSTPKSVVMLVSTSGEVTLQNTSGTAISSGNRIRPTHTTWFTEV